MGLLLANQWSNSNRFDAVLFIRVLLITFGLGLLIHGYSYANTLYNHDGLMALVSDVDSREVELKLSLGRFMHPVYYLFRGHLSIAWLTGILSLLFQSIGNYYLIRLFGFKKLYLVVAVCALMISNYSLVYLNATFIHESDVYSLAFALSCLAAYLLDKDKKWVWVFPILVAMSMGLYQAFLSVVSVLVMFTLIRDIISGMDFKLVLRRAIKAFLALIAGAILYLIIVKIVAVLGAVGDTSHNNSVSQVGMVPLYALHSYIFYVYLPVFQFFATPPTVSLTHSLSLMAAHIIGFGGAAYCIYAVAKKYEISKCSWLLLIILLGLVPFAINVSCFFTHKFCHQAMIIPFTVLYILALLAFNQWMETDKERQGQSRYVRLVCILVACVYLVRFVHASQVYFEKHLSYQTTQANVTKIMMQMEQYDDYVVGETPVMFIGSFAASPSNTYRPGFGFTFNRFRLYPNVSADYQAALKDFFEVIYNYPINLVTDAQPASYIDAQRYIDFLTPYGEKPEIKAMPLFPQKGYCQMIDGVMVVKLSEMEKK